MNISCSMKCSEHFWTFHTTWNVVCTRGLIYDNHPLLPGTKLQNQQNAQCPCRPLKLIKLCWIHDFDQYALSGHVICFDTDVLNFRNHCRYFLIRTLNTAVHIHRKVDVLDEFCVIFVLILLLSVETKYLMKQTVEWLRKARVFTSFLFLYVSVSIGLLLLLACFSMPA